MRTRSMGQWVFTLVIVALTAIAAVSCGSSSGSTFQPGQSDSGDDSTVVGGDDANNGSLGNDGGMNGGCKPKTCADQGYSCGKNGDGCGGILDCGTCTSPQYCGGGGYSKCGGFNGMAPDGATMGNCTPETCQSLGIDCGQTGDGCGGILNCGSCTSPQYCGGGGFNKCGGNNGQTPDGGVPCTPTTCQKLGYDCGFAGDGCGGLLNCGTCNNPQYCGGKGFNLCGGNNGLNPDGGVACTPTTCKALGYTCGVAADGCGGTLQCGTCTSPQYCGGGGYDKCGGNNGLNPDGGVSCTPTTCQALGYNCGYAGDGCGGLLNCGGNSCPSPEYCGGGGYDQCGPTSSAACDGGSAPTLTGYVFDPGNNLPVYNALVYVPVGAVQTPQTGVVPSQCGCSAPPAYASAYTDISGKFTMTNVPTGAITLVVQLGKWQRVFNETIVCGTNALGGGTVGATQNLTLPSTRAEGNIPLFAVDTGSVDTLECVLLKMGIDQSEFMNPVISNGVPTAPGRVQFYQGGAYVNGGGGAIIDNYPTGSTTPLETDLTTASSVMNSYDVILFPCQGAAGTYDSTSLTNLINFTSDGGRAFTTHFHYDLLEGNGSFDGTANWVGDSNYQNNATGYIDTTFTRGLTLAKWLNQTIVYGGTYGQIPVSVIRQDFSSVNAPAQRWMYESSKYPIHYTFDTPFVKGGADGTCGRVVYSDFHVEASNGSTGQAFPSECTSGGLTAQEKLLEFMIFDLTSCVSAPTCTPLTCQQQNVSCGYAGDSCGGQLNCGTCSSGQSCVGGKCVTPPDGGGNCTPQTCSSQMPPVGCGYTGDGCGGQLFCGNCPQGQSCVGGKCVAPPDGSSCVPQTCSSQVPPIACGYTGDGCGGQLFCGNCPQGQSCVGGQCVAPDAGGSCAPQSCMGQNPPVACGFAGDGCGGQLFCGNCPSGQTCVGGQCVTPDAGGSCAPETCQQQGIMCGPAGDGCGNLLQCGPCPTGQTCGGGGVHGQCGATEAGSCMPLTCQQLKINCGPAGDGCGGLLDCGMCTAPQTCGGGGVAGQCGGGAQ